MTKPWKGAREECSRCGSLVGVSGDFLADHKGTNGRVCPERRQPVKGKKPKRSVHASSAGLPGLGKGRT